jgi:uncharacterized membrane protein YhaH (DUF805 family)
MPGDGAVTIGDWYLRRGRIPRRTWWLHYVLPLVLLGVVAQLVDESLGFHHVVVHTGAYMEPVYTYASGPFAVVVSLVTIVPWTSALVCRLHDRDHSAWWLLWFLLPGIGYLVLFITAGFLPGIDHSNRYGPAPLPGRSGALPRSR